MCFCRLLWETDQVWLRGDQPRDWVRRRHGHQPRPGQLRPFLHLDLQRVGQHVLVHPLHPANHPARPYHEVGYAVTSGTLTNPEWTGFPLTLYITVSFLFVWNPNIPRHISWNSFFILKSLHSFLPLPPTFGDLLGSLVDIKGVLCTDHSSSPPPPPVFYEQLLAAFHSRP